MLKEKAAILQSCGKAIAGVYSTGIPATPDQRVALKEGRMVLREIMADLLKDDPAYLRYIELSLRALHPTNDYCEDMFIRDIADVCITVSRLENGGTRSESKKLVDALSLCQLLVDDLTSGGT